MNEYRKMTKTKMIRLMIDDGETLETRSGAELFFKESDSKCDSPFRFKYQDAEMTLSEAWGHECRVKDVPKTVPYTIETFPFDRDGGMCIKNNNNNNRHLIVVVTDTGIAVRSEFIDYGDLVNENTWADGSPCGIIE